MAAITYSLRVTNDNVVTVRVGRAVEAFSLDNGKAELYEKVKWSLISKGVPFNQDRLVEELHHLLNSRNTVTAGR